MEHTLKEEDVRGGEREKKTREIENNKAERQKICN